MVDFVFLTRTIVVTYFFDVTHLHLRFIQLRGLPLALALVGNNNWIHQGVSVDHIYLGGNMA